MEHRFKCIVHSTGGSHHAACASLHGNDMFLWKTEKYICSRSTHLRLVRTATHGSLLVDVSLLGAAESLCVILPSNNDKIESVVASHSGGLEARAVVALRDLLAHRLGALHMSISNRLARLVLALGGLDREDNVLALAIHTNSALLADSHALRTYR